MNVIKDLEKTINEYPWEQKEYIEKRNVEYLSMYFAYTIANKLDKKNQELIIKLVNESPALTDEAKKMFHKELNTWLQRIEN